MPYVAKVWMFVFVKNISMMIRRDSHAICIVQVIRARTFPQFGVEMDAWYSLLHNLNINVAPITVSAACIICFVILSTLIISESGIFPRYLGISSRCALICFASDRGIKVRGNSEIAQWIPR